MAANVYFIILSLHTTGPHSTKPQWKNSAI